MKSIDTDFITITILDEHSVLVEVKEGVEINLERAQWANQLIQDEMPGDYGMIINRKADYSIVPHEVYEVLNSLTRLKAIAIIVHRKSFLPLDIEKRFYNNQLEAFETLSEARAWLRDVLEYK